MTKCIYANKCLLHIPYNLIKDTNIRIDSIDIDVKVDDRTSTYEEIFLADIEDGYDKVETQADFDRFVSTLKPKYRDAYVTMAEVGERVKEGYVPLGINKYLRNSAPLPKGHGELVDRNGINERFDSIYNDAINCSNQPSDKYLLDKLSMCLDTALPIIEADKEI